MPTFSMTMDIDENGVVVVVLSGTFDASEWLRQRRAAFERRYTPGDYDGRPALVDMRNCLLPDRDWAAQFKGLGLALKQRRPKPFRSAIVMGEQPAIEEAIALFAAHQKIFHHPGVQVRGFRDYDEAYAWALEGLEAAFPETPKAPASRGLRETRDEAPNGQRE